MIFSNITLPRSAICGKCNILVSLSAPVLTLARANIALNGDTDDVDFELTGSGAVWVLAFTFPQDVSGRLTLGLTGQVTPTGSDDPIDLESAEVSFAYDTCNTITAAWGEPIYQRGQVVLPITFSQAVVGLTKSFFRVEMGSKDVKLQVYGTGDDQTFNLQLRPPRGVTGTMTVRLVRAVRKRNGVELNANLADIEIEYPGV